MPYTHFRYIAYEVPTVARITGESPQYTFPCGTVTDPPVLVTTSTDDLTEDAKVRIQRLIAVMITAYEHIRTNGDSDSTLKVFMAPEFYFRPNLMRTMGYTYSQYKAIKKVLRATLDADERFTHWLVVPGTIIWIWEDYKSLKRPIKKGLRVYMNSAIYIKKGVKSRVIEKAEASGIDGIPDKEQKAYSHEVWKTKYKSGIMALKHFFKIETLNLGLEICLEHGLPILKTAIAGTGITATGVDLQLLTAGGMPMLKQAIVAKVSGFILRNDGYYAEGNYTLTDLLYDSDDPRDSDRRDFGSSTPEVSDYTNMRMVDRYREGTITPKTLINSTPGSARGRPFLTTITRKHDIAIASGSRLYLSLPTGFATERNASQRIRIFDRQQLPS